LIEYPTKQTWCGRIIALFIYSCALVLLIAAAAKLVSVFGDERILDEADPLLQVANRWVYSAAGLVELAVVWWLMWGGKKTSEKLMVLAWLGTVFALYRFGLFWFKFDKPCSCMGNAFSWAGLGSETMDAIAFGLFLYLAIGAYFFGIIEWQRGRSMRVAA
jgi:hypothetical protein